jgi:2,4-dienoyl-CoA reductase-like NADH-dependent reductase (Old Yellow Enzyme family)
LRQVRQYDSKYRSQYDNQKESASMSGSPALFSPLRLRGLTIRNRVVVAPMCQYRAEDGKAVLWHTVHHGKFAMAGVGIGFVEATAVAPEGRITPGCTGIWNDDQVDGLAQIAALYEAYGAVPAIQLSHAGWKGSAARPLEGAGPLAAAGREPAWETVGPSRLAPKDGWPACRELDRAGIEEVKQAWRLAFRRARAAGYKIVEIHGGHGYLVHTFLSPHANKRTDEYGGSLAGRMRFALEIAEIARAEWPQELPVFFRISALDDVKDGWTMDDSVALSHELKARGIDVIDCSSGGLTSLPPSGRSRPPQGFQVPFASRIRREVGIATMAVGLITEPQFANDIVAAGEADLVALAREFMANPNWAFHAALALGDKDAFKLLPRDYALFLERRAAMKPGQNA